MTNPFKRLLQPTVFLAHIIALTIVLIFGIAIGLAAPCLPSWEGFLRPIVQAEPAIAADVSRDRARVCFTLHLHKLHAGMPQFYQYAVEVRQNEHWLAPGNVNAHVVDERTGQPHDDYQNHPLDARWDRRWCADLPASVAPYQVIRVSGYAVHNAHPLWATHSPMPAFVVGGV